MPSQEEQTTPELSQESTSQVEEQETAASEDQESETASTESTEEAATSEEQKVEPEKTNEGQEHTREPERHQTRAEKRLSQVLHRSQGNPVEELAKLSKIEPDQDGMYTPEQLQQMAAQSAAQVIQMDREAQAYQQQTNDFADDAESVGEQIVKEFGTNKVLAEKLNTMITARMKEANIRMNENGEPVFVPTTKASVIYAELKDVLNLTKSQGTEETTVKLVQQAAEGAITPGNHSEESNGESIDELRANLWNNPGGVRKILAKRNPRSND